METLKIGMRIRVHQNFLENWLRVDDVIIVKSRPYFRKKRYFAMTSQVVQILYLCLFFDTES